MSVLTITDAAAARVAALLQDNPDKSALRVSVEGGGCSGFQYDIHLTNTQNSDDISCQHNGITVLVDEASVPFLTGSTLDFIDELGGTYFKVSNPNATARCGCGNSFSA